MTNKQKQHLLAYLGYYTATVDGIWGDKSRQATKDLQHDHGLTEDGDFGDATLAAAKDAVTNDRFKATISEADDDVTDFYVGDNAVLTGTFWDEIEFFDREEFRCTCGGRGCTGFPAEPVERLVRNAEAARKYFGKTARVSSGVRCQLRNSELPGSAANSLHMRGKAMDFCILGIPASETLAYVKTLPDVHEAYAIDNSYVHMGVLKY